MCNRLVHIDGLLLEVEAVEIVLLLVDSIELGRFLRLLVACLTG